ncbi:MAG: PBP1A family penicillin-binding protein [Lachnospiraceae bacterium]|nr:PBP1A family penicillin-binding protein [Lachnospiraceae bacterium]
MDFSKAVVEKERTYLRSKKARAGKKFILTFVKTALIFLLLAVAVLAVVVFLRAKKIIDEIPDISAIDITPTGYLTTIYDKNGNEIQSLAAAGANRQYVELSEIPLDLQHAFVAIEDERFYKHNGIDIRGIIRAVVADLASGDMSQGASTITQQLLKNNYFTGWMNENTISDKLKRKLQEQYLAIQLEKKISKGEILENYLNTINLGQNTLGVEAASERYFNKRVSDLTLSECACIAGITQNPSRYNPITHPDYNNTRRKSVLQHMYDQGYITAEEYEAAVADDVYSRISVVNNSIIASSTSYFVDALTSQVIKDLKEQRGYSETEAYRMLYAGGLRIESTQDPEIQKVVDEEINRLENYANSPEVSISFRLTVEKPDKTYQNYSEQTMLSFYQSEDPLYDINYSSQEEALAAYEHYKSEIIGEGDRIPDAGESVTYTVQPQTACTVIDQSTGYVVALCGGRGDKTASRTLNRATDTTRQPGSCFKILAAFAPALDAGGKTLASVQDDSPMTYTNGIPLRNYDDRYRGFTNVREAITDSINVVTVKTLMEIGTGLGYQYVQNFGITTLESGDNNQALALGGISRGVKNIELTGAYATIANGGVYNRPMFYTRVLARNGDVVLDASWNNQKEVLKPTTAWLLTDAMKDVMVYGTGQGANIDNMPIAGKSGTTTNDRDTVFAGYTPYYTCAVWGGYDDNTPQKETQYSKAIFRGIMQRINEGLPVRDFDKPSGITELAVCRKSGKLPLDDICEADVRGSQIYTEYFDEDTTPYDSCDHHTTVSICSASNLPAGIYCPAEDVGKRVFILGASPGGEDYEYSITPEELARTCNIHTEPQPVTPPVPVVPGGGGSQTSSATSQNPGSSASHTSNSMSP